MWIEYLCGEGAETEAEIIRAKTHTGRPLGGDEFVKGLEKILRRRLAPQKGGRPPAQLDDQRQEVFVFER